MKLRLNLTLRRCLLSTFAVVATLSTGNVAQGSILYSSVGMQTYTDFGQNCGRYQAGRVNDLLSSIRREEDGVKIYYIGEKFENYSFTLPHGMIDFSSGSVSSVDAAIGYGFLATVQHNGVQNPAYAAAEVGTANAVKYAGIEYRNGNIGLGEAADEVFLYCPHTDYKITRLSKLVTDVRTSDVYNNTEMLGQPLTGQFLYRAGSGTMKMAQVDENGMANAGEATGLRGAYSYVTGGLITIDGWGQRETQEGGDFNYSVNHTVPANVYGYITGEQASGQVNPLPYVSLAGDSGSPSWVWNETTGTYQYLSALQSGGGTYSQDRGAWYWTLEKMESFNKRVELGEDSLIRFTAVNQEGSTISGNADNTTLTVTQHLGSLLYGEETIQFAGNQLNTWADLNDLRDEANWYTYGNGYLNANGNVSKADDGKISYGELMHTDSIILTATTDSPYTVQLDDTVDTGIGFVQFSKADEVESARFNLVSENGEQNQLNTAGFVVDAGVTLDISLTGDSEYLREWRKVGDGDLRISGNGDNDILLNVGGGSIGTNDGSTAGHTSGKVYLDRTDGYAAYNVLASTGSTIVLSNTQQVKHDVTLGAGGATLDLNGNDYTWNNSAENNDVFTLHMLTEKDILANHGESAATVTIKDAGDTLLGSFEDSESGAMKVIYDGGDKALAMHSVFTDLKHNRDSGFTVKSGSVSLGGTMTVHGTGSLTGTNTDRVENPNDWHYADAKMDVTVQDGATFTLDSHARLTGDVTVEEGGTFVMKEGTKHRYEYIEGGFFAEDTQNAFYSQFHGLKGNITLNDGALNIVYNAGVDAHNTYAGSISGSGSMQIDLGTSGAILTLGGDNSQFTPEIIEAVSGGVIAESKKAIGAKGNNATIRLQEKAWLGVKGASAADILPYITADSAGVLALTQNEEQQLGLGAFANLIIGALEGMSIEYGLRGTDVKLMANADNQWLLGGGGGELVVNFALQNENGTLVLGNEYTTGSVKLTNTGNSFKAIDFRGLVTLEYEEGTLGGADIHLNYGNRVLGSDSTMLLLNDNVSGTMLLDKMAEENIDLGNRTSLYLGTSQNITYTGTITTADNTYRLGGTTGILSLAQALTGDRNLSVDGQHYSGGVIELQQPTTLTGHVTVMGYDSTQTDRTGGDITLRLCQDNSLAKAASVTLKDGGILDITGTRQQLNNLSMAAGSVLKGNELEHNSSVEANLHQDSSLQGTIAVDAFTLAVGKGTTATLGGEVKVNTLTKSGEGTLMLMLDGSFTGNLTIGSGTVKIDNDHALGAYNTDDSRSITINQGGTLDYCGEKDNEKAYAVTLNGGTLTNSGDGIGHTSRQLITKLTVTANSFIDSDKNFGLIANGYNTTRLELNGGSLEKKGSGTYHIANADITATKNEALKVSGGELSFIDKGEDKVSRLGADITLTGGTVSGKVQLSKDLTVTLSGGTLSASFDTVEHQLTFDTALTNATASGAISGNGTVRKIGSDNLTLTAASTLHHVSVEQGKLVLSSAGADIEGNVSIATGATLEMGSNLNLRSGQTLSVIGNSSTPATLGSVLELNGGSLAFDGNALSNEQYALSVNGLTKSASGLTINFFNTSYLTDGATYKLVSGDWSALNPGDDFFTVTGIEYLKSALTKGKEGLSVTFSLDENCSIWDGTPDKQIWSSEVFGQQQRTTTDENILVFNDSASSKTIVVEGSQLARSLVFDTLGHYIVDTTRGSVQTTDVDVYNDGNATLGSGVTVSGEALVGRGSLTVTDTATLEHAQSIRGDGTIVIDWGQESGTVSAINELHALTVKSGQFNAEATVQTDVVTVQRGGQFNAAGTTQTAAFILSGTGRTEAEDKAALVLNNGASISGSLSLNGDAAIEVAEANNGTATLSGAINGGEYTLSKNGAGTLGISAVSAMELKGLTVEEGTVLMHRNNSVAKNIGTLQLNNGTTFTQYSDEEPNSNASAAIETLVMGGSSATLKSTNHAGSFNIGTLRNADGLAAATLNLVNNSSVARYTFFELGRNDAETGNFAGNIDLSSTAPNGQAGYRSATIVISNGNITKDAVVNLSSTVSGTARLALGLHDETVTVAGLASGKSLGSRAFLFSGDAVANQGDVRKEDIARTLAVNTAAETDAVFNGAVDANINIIKSGLGTQTFAGASTSFNGTITVQDGTLGLFDTRMLRQATEITIAENGTMKLDGLMALDSTVIHNNGTLIFGSNTQYILGDISTPTTYTMVNGSGHTTGLSLANFFYNGQSLLGYSAGVRLLFSDNAVTLRITETPDSRTIMWNGDSGNVWDNGETTAWTYEGDATESYYRTDSVVFGAAGDKNVSIANGTATNAMTVQAGDYSFTGMAGLTVNGTLSINEGASATFDALTANQTQQITANGAVTAGATEITDGTATFNSTAHFTNGIRIDGGTTTFNDTVTVDATAADYEMVINRGTVAINGQMTVNGNVQLGENKEGTANSLIIIGKQGVLSVGKLNSAWGFDTLTVNGVVNTTHFNLSTGTTQTITGSGTINADHLTGGNNGVYNFSGVRLNIGNDGMDGGRPLNFTDMTLGALGNWTANRNITLAGNITIDTAKYDKASGQDTAEGTTITLSNITTSELTSLTKTGEGTLALNAAHFNGSNAINLTLDGGTLKLNNAVLSLHGGILNITGNTTIDVSGVNVDTIAKVSAYQDGTDHTNGYLQGTYQALVSGGTAIMADDVALTAGEGLRGKTLELFNNSICLKESTPDNIVNHYFIHSETNYGNNEANTAYNRADALVLNAGDAVLNLKTNLNGKVCTGGIVTEVAGGLVNIGQGVTLKTSDLHATKDVKLGGNGVYEMSQVTRPEHISWDENWQGTVDIVSFAGSTDTNIKLEELGRAGSSIRLNGTQGYLTKNTEIAADVELNGPAALKITNGYSDTGITFNGAIKGNGNLEKNWASGGSSCNLEFDFNGDTSAWTGAFVNSAWKGDSTLVFASGAKKMGAAIQTTSTAKTHIEVGTDTAAAEIIFKNTIQASSLNLQGESSATLQKNAALGQVESHSGTLVLENTARLGLSTTDTDNLSGAKLKLSAHNTPRGGSISGSIRFNVDGDNTYTVSGTEETMGRLDNTLLELADATSLKLEHIVVTADSVLQAENSGELLVQHVVLIATIGTNATIHELNQGYQAMSLAATDTPTPTPTADAVLTLGNLQNLTLTGDSLTINLSMDYNILQELANQYKWVGITLEPLSDFEDVTSVAVSCNGVLLENTFRSEDGGMVLFDTSAVPEPTTGTLSLLALTALCARRRRK